MYSISYAYGIANARRMLKCGQRVLAACASRTLEHEIWDVTIKVQLTSSIRRAVLEDVEAIVALAAVGGEDDQHDEQPWHEQSEAAKHP